MTAPRPRIIVTLAALLLAVLALDDGKASALPGDYCTSSARDCLAGREVCFTTNLAASAGRCTPGKVLP